ncbi:MAG: hypothetical protein U0804_01930 [Gemmataceae bacterium]
MRVVLPVGCVVVFVVVVKLAWAEVHEAITSSTSNSPYLQSPPPSFSPARPRAEEEPPADTRVFAPDEVLPPPATQSRRNQYRDPRSRPPAGVHPAERVVP